MTNEQYDRWKDFSTRMAQSCFRGSRRPASSWIIEQVDNWFYWRDFQKDWGNYNSWDQDKYPLCDHVREFFYDLGPRITRCKRCAHYCDERCPLCELDCRCDQIEELAYEQFEDQWMGPIHCCLRAGIDLACEPSMGVCGFTAGDIRRMYPEGLPEWLLQVFSEYNQSVTPVAVVPGVGFVPEVREIEPSPFETWPDSEHVWL